MPVSHAYTALAGCADFRWRCKVFKLLAGFGFTLAEFTDEHLDNTGTKAAR